MKQFVKEFQANSSRGLAEEINDYAIDGYKIVSLSITCTQGYGCPFHAIVVFER
ncbi:MAG: hypothetical protein IKL00_08805 [Oscillospiraceae bacterium]|nr:hypothetical protein [Oscillospiraceae bacterium]